jgi:hypothetical protein
LAGVPVSARYPAYFRGFDTEEMSRRDWRKPKRREREKIREAFGPEEIEVLWQEAGVKITGKYVTMNPFLRRSPAAVVDEPIRVRLRPVRITKARIFYVNSRMLRAPPKVWATVLPQLRVIFGMHVFFYLIFPNLTEKEIKNLTLLCLLENPDLLESHIQFLKNNTFGLIGKK